MTIPTTLSNESLTNSQDPKWVAEGLAYWSSRQPGQYLTRKRISTELDMFRYWARALGIDESGHSEIEHRAGACCPDRGLAR